MICLCPFARDAVRDRARHPRQPDPPHDRHARHRHPHRRRPLRRPRGLLDPRPGKHPLPPPPLPPLPPLLPRVGWAVSRRADEGAPLEPARLGAPTRGTWLTGGMEVTKIAAPGGSNGGGLLSYYSLRGLRSGSCSRGWGRRPSGFRPRPSPTRGIDAAAGLLATNPGDPQPATPYSRALLPPRGVLVPSSVHDSGRRRAVCYPRGWGSAESARLAPSRYPQRSSPGHQGLSRPVSNTVNPRP